MMRKQWKGGHRQPEAQSSVKLRSFTRISFSPGCLYVCMSEGDQCGTVKPPFETVKKRRRKKGRVKPPCENPFLDGGEGEGSEVQGREQAARLRGPVSSAFRNVQRWKA